MTNHVLLDNVTHGDIKIDTRRHPELGDNLSLTGVFPSEYSKLQGEYPLFFKRESQNGRLISVALLGFEPGENLFVTEEGWQANYLPLTIMRQPFLIGYQQRMENGVPVKEPCVHIDMDSPRVNREQGEAVFLPEGGISPYLEHINSVLLTIHQGHQYQQEFIQVLESLSLIEPALLEVTLKDGTKQGVEGLFSINEEVLAGLTPEQAGSLHQQGYMQHVYMMLASLAQVNQLIRRKNQRLGE